MKDWLEQTVAGSGVQGSSPHGTGQSCVLQDWLSVSLADPGQLPPHASITIFLLVLVLSCVPPPQSALQVSQSLHCDQDPHRQFVGGRVPDSVRLSEQSPVLQPSLQVRVWLKDSPEQTVPGSGVHGSSPHSTTSGQGCVLQDWLSVSLADPEQVPPHTALKAMLLVLLLLCLPPSQSALQVPQSPHCSQAPH